MEEIIESLERAEEKIESEGLDYGILEEPRNKLEMRHDRGRFDPYTFNALKKLRKLEEEYGETSESVEMMLEEYRNREFPDWSET